MPSGCAQQANRIRSSQSPTLPSNQTETGLLRPSKIYSCYLFAALIRQLAVFLPPRSTISVSVSAWVMK